MSSDPIPYPHTLSNQPAYAFLVQFPAVCFFGTLVTDIVYSQTQLFIWETFSVWLLAAGCVAAGLAGIVGLILFVSDRRLRMGRFAWAHAAASLFAALLSVVNAFVHSRDGYTAVVPTGLTLSAIVVLLMLVASWMGWSRMSRYQQIGVPA